MRRNAFQSGALGFTFGFLLCVGLFEAVLAWFPVTHGLNGNYPSPLPFATYLSNRQFTYSTGWKFDVVGTGRINNYGLASSRDFARDMQTVAVIGDSYVEGVMLEQKDTAQDVLQTMFPLKSIYGVGVSGASLATYLHQADFAKSTFSPSAVAVLIVAGDIEESLERRPGHPYVLLEGRLPMLAQMPKVMVAKWKQVLARSRVVQYVLRNLHFSLDVLLPAFGRTKPDSSKDRDSYTKVVQFFFDELPRRCGLPASNIAILVDADRHHMTPDGNTSSGQNDAEQNWLRALTLRSAREAGFKVIDMEPIFRTHYQSTGKRVDFMPVDYHWNAAAHRQAANAIAAWLRELPGTLDTSSTMEQ